MSTGASLPMSEIGPLCSFLSSCTWALGATTYASMSKNYSSPAVNFSRAMVAFPLFCLALFFFNGQELTAFHPILELKGVSWWWFAASIIGSFALGDTLFLLSTQTLGVPTAMAIASTFPIWSSIAGWVFLGNRFHPLMALGVVLVVAGTIMVILSESSRARKRLDKTSAPEPMKKYWAGVVLALGTSFLWALNGFGLAMASRGLSPILANVVRALLSMVLCPLVGVVLFRRSFKFIPLRQLKAPLWIFVLEAFGGSLLFMYGLSHSPLATSSALSSLAPVVALCLAWVINRNSVSRPTTIAVGIVMVGIWLLVGVRF